MKLTRQQIIEMAPFAAYVRINGSMYRMDYVVADGIDDRLAYSDPDSNGEEYVSPFSEVMEADVVFFELKPMAVVG